MSRFEAEPRATKPKDFDPWAVELGLYAECEGLQALLGIVTHYAPVECVRWLAVDQPLWAQLVARAREADRQRFSFGVAHGRRMGV